MPRPPVKSPRRRNTRAPVGAILVLPALLLLPGIAIYHGLPRSIAVGVVAYVVTMSLIAFLVTRADKRKAQAQEWRTPEATLHFLELIGGWPGAFLAQRLYRHKTAKLSYQIVFWIIVVIHQVAAVDSVQGFKLLRQLFDLIPGGRS